MEESLEEEKMKQTKSSTLRQILVQAESAFGPQDAFRYKVKDQDEEGKKKTTRKDER